MEFYRIVIYGDYVDMLEFGVWIFYWVGIGLDGMFYYFVVGD